MCGPFRCCRYVDQCCELLPPVDPVLPVVPLRVDEPSLPRSPLDAVPPDSVAPDSEPLSDELPDEDDALD